MLISSLIYCYDIDFVRWIQIKIHVRAFSESTIFPFPYLIQKLCDAARVPPILEVDQQIAVTRMVDIGMNKDEANLIIAHRAYPPFFSSTTHFKRPFILDDPIKRLGVSIDMNVGTYSVDPTTTAGGEGATDTSTPATPSTSAPAEAAP